MSTERSTTSELSLGPAIDAALAVLGRAPVSAVAVGGWRAGRVTYCVTLAGGQVVKVRQLRNRNRVTRAAALVQAIDDPRMPPALAVVGAVTVESWVDGTVLASRRPDGRHLDAAAELLADLHGRRVVEGHRFRRHQSTAAARARAERQLADLVDLGVLPRRDATELGARLGHDLPDAAVRGVTHGDLRAENLVVTGRGELVSIDNEAVHIDFLASDLGRTWSRWPMATSDWDRFRRRYAEHTAQDVSTDDEAAWCIVAAVKGAHRWGRARRPTTDAPLRALARAVDAFVTRG